MAEEFLPLVHELAHEMLNKAERRTTASDPGGTRASGNDNFVQKQPSPLGGSIQFQTSS